MIECIDEKIWYVKKKKRNKKSKLKSIRKALVFLLMFIAFFYYLLIINESILNTATEKIKEISITSVNDAVLTSISTINYNDLMVFERDLNGKITLISVNSTLANRITRTVSQSSKILINENLKNGIPIPIGAFSGVGILSGKGKIVYLNLYNIESVVCDFTSEFNDAGINQTLHRLYLSVDVTASILFTNDNNYIKTNSKILLAENVIVGEIPNFYLNNDKR